MKIEKTYIFGIKAVFIISAILFFIIAIIGHFYGAPHFDQSTLDIFNVKLADLTIGHAVWFVFLLYVLFGK